MLKNSQAVAEKWQIPTLRQIKVYMTDMDYWCTNKITAVSYLKVSIIMPEVNKIVQVILKGYNMLWNLY